MTENMELQSTFGLTLFGVVGATAEREETFMKIESRKTSEGSVTVV